MQTTLTRIFIVLKSVSHGFSENQGSISQKSRNFKHFTCPKLGDLQKKKKKTILRLIFRPKSQIQRFFSPKIRWSPKKNRSSPILRLVFRPISENQTFEGGLFSDGGAIFNFLPKIGIKSTKNVRFCILHKPMGGAKPPRPPWLRYWLYQYHRPTAYLIQEGYVARLCASALMIVSHNPVSSTFFLSV